MVSLNTLENLNQEIANFLNCFPAVGVENQKFSYVIKELENKIIAEPINRQPLDFSDNANAVILQVGKMNNSFLASMNFYEKGICISEYVNFTFEYLDLEKDCNDDIEFRTISFESNKNDSRFLSLDVSPYLSVRNSFKLPVDYNVIIAQLLNAPVAEIDDDGIAHYILKTVNGQLMVDITPIEKWTEETYNDALILDMSYLDQKVSVSQYKNNKYIGGCSVFTLKNIERIEDNIILYSKDDEFGKLEIQLKPFIKVRHIV